MTDEHATRTVLVAVTGMSPQVITETLYGMHQRGEERPARLVIITTGVGAGVLRHALFEAGWLERLCRELGWARFPQEAVHVSIIPAGHQAVVDDARSVGDHEDMGDHILATVRDLTVDPATRIHASIAGGRKTMTFYLGYAMTLFGRQEDCLSHVLVDEGFESLPDFFFPPSQPTPITVKDGIVADAATAGVCLADIPFIRHRNMLPAFVLEPTADISFRKLIDLINLGHSQEKIRLVLDDAERMLNICRESTCLARIPVANGFDWACYRLVAMHTQERDAGLRRCPDERDISQGQGWKMLTQLSHLLGLPVDFSADYRTEVERWASDYEAELEAFEIRPTDFFKTMRFGLGEINQPINRIRRLLRSALPEPLADHLEIKQVLEEDGSRRDTAGRGLGYGIGLDPHQISIPLKEASQA